MLDMLIISHLIKGFYDIGSVNDSILVDLQCCVMNLWEMCENVCSV